MGILTEGVITPGRNFTLQQDAVAVTVIEDATILLPVHPGQDAIQILKVIVIVSDPSCRLGHTEFGVAARHTLDTHEPQPLTIQVKATFIYIDGADAEGCVQLVEN